MNKNENDTIFPTMESILDVSVESEGVTRKMATVRIADGVFADVMNIWEDGEIKLRYVMDNPTGTTTYAFDGEFTGNLEDYGMAEQEIVEFVIPYVPDENTPDRDF